MIHSMTAFARSADQGEWGSAVWEVRSVNHRYLDCIFRLPELLRPLEIPLRERARKRLQRGKVECSLKFVPGEAVGTELVVNTSLVQQLASAAETVSEHLPKPASINPWAMLSWPGVLNPVEVELDAVRELIVALFDKTLDDLASSREQEGKALKQFIEQRLEGVSHEVEGVQKRLPVILKKQREKLTARLAEIKGELDATRLEQEMVMFSQKVDVAEELSRLEMHVKEVHRVLKQKGSVGKRLDFLMQEFNREANTLGSKSADAETTRAAVELKVLIEQMREQIQNVE